MYCRESISRKISVLSFIAMVTVVCIHSDPLPLMEDLDSFCTNLSVISSMLKEWAVPYFYVVSGFFFARCYMQRTYWQFMKGKVRSLIIPYLLWGGVYGTIMMLPLEMAVNKFHGDSLLFNTRIVGGVLHTLDRIFGIFYSSPYDGALWYVRMLILFFALAPIWIFVLKRCDWLLFVLGVVGVCVFMRGGDQHDILFSIGNWNFDITFSSIAWLLLGMFVASRHLEERHCNFAILLGIIGFVINLSLSPHGCQLVQRLWALALLWFVWNIYDVLPTVLPEKLPHFFTLSFFCYCIHHPLTGYYGASLRFLFGRTGSASYLMQIVLIPFFTVLTGVLVGMFLKNKLPRLYNVLNGGR